MRGEQQEFGCSAETSANKVLHEGGAAKVEAAGRGANVNLD